MAEDALLNTTEADKSQFIQVNRCKNSSQSLEKISSTSTTPLRTDSDLVSEKSDKQTPIKPTQTTKVLFSVPSIDERDSSSSVSASQGAQVTNSFKKGSIE